MSVIAEAEELALSLSNTDRGKLISQLIKSLGAPFDDNDDGIDEAIRRSREMDENPTMSLSEEEFDLMISESFPECVGSEPGAVATGFLGRGGDEATVAIEPVDMFGIRIRETEEPSRYRSRF